MPYTLYKKSGSTGGQGLEYARICILEDSKRKSEFKVQFNPNKLGFSSSGGQSSLKTVSGSDDPSNVPSLSDVTMSVELMFDSINNNRVSYSNSKDSGSRTPSKMSRKSGRGTRFFPNGYENLSGDVNTFYDIMRNNENKTVEFMWGQMSFIGVVTSVNMNISIFDSQANPMRATVSLQIKGTQDKKKQ